MVKTFEMQELAKGISHFADSLLTGFVHRKKYNDNYIKPIAQANQLDC